MRDPKELIAELEAESKNFWVCCLVVGFEKRTEFVWSKEKEKLGMLNKLMQAGGEPVGLIGVTRENENRVATYYCRPLKELEQEPWVGNYLNALLDSIKTTVLASGAATELRASETGWVN
jgi:hypothetical protein